MNTGLILQFVNGRMGGDTGFEAGKRDAEALLDAFKGKDSAYKIGFMITWGQFFGEYLGDDTDEGGTADAEDQDAGAAAGDI